MGFKEILTKAKVFCLDCSVSLLLFSNIWKFICLAELSIQKKESAQVNELYQFVLFVPASWEEEDVRKKKN